MKEPTADIADSQEPSSPKPMDWKSSMAAEDDFDRANPHACLPPTGAAYRQARKAQAQKAQAQAVPERPAVGKATSGAGAPPENPPENPPDNPPGYPAPAPETFDPLVSMVKGAKDPAVDRDLKASKIVALIASDLWQKRVEAIRQTYSQTLSAALEKIGGTVKEARQEAKNAARPGKEQLKAALFCGTFSYRNNDSLTDYSGLLCADLDDLEADKLTALRGKAEQDRHVGAVFLSPTGSGLKIVFRVAGDARQHHQNFLAVRQHVKNKYGLPIDEACKDVARLCFVSYDPQAAWHGDAVALPPLIEDAAMPARGGVKKEPERGLDRYRPKTKPVSNELLRELLMGDGEKYKGIPADDRGDWLKFLGAIKLWGQETGQEDFAYDLADRWAQTSKKKYRAEEQEKLWNDLNREPDDNVARIGSIIYLARQNGWKGRESLPPDTGDFEGVTAWIRGKIIESMQDNGAPASVKNSEVASQVVAALAKVGRFYFHADLRDYDSAMFFNATRKRLERVRADSFSAWLSTWLCVNRAAGLFKYILAAVETDALSGPHTTGILPESYWAARTGAIYLSNGDGRAVKISAACVEMVDNGSDGVLFAAGQTCAPWNLTEPQDVFETCAIFRSLHTRAGHALDLLRVWIYSLPTNPACKPPLCLAGEIGSGKTRLAKAIAEFYGLPVVTAKVEEEREGDFWPCCNGGGIYTLDNADTKCRWLADALANASTGGCSQGRKLYTDGETVTLRARAWLCVTTANPTFAADSGLADRLLLLRMARRGQQSSDAALTDEILAKRDAGLSHVALMLQRALADNEPTPAGLNSRHPDWAAFAVKIGRAFGREAEVVTALQTAEADKSAFCLENDSIGAALLAYLAQAGNFSGTAAELVPKIIEMDIELQGRLSPKRLGKRLAALWPHLEKRLGMARKGTTRLNTTAFIFKK